jgi:hypothetical protein
MTIIAMGVGALLTLAAIGCALEYGPAVREAIRERRRRRAMRRDVRAFARGR